MAEADEFVVLVLEDRYIEDMLIKAYADGLRGYELINRVYTKLREMGYIVNKMRVKRLLCNLVPRVLPRDACPIHL